MPKRKLVVIGNGTSGVRVIEEVLALGGRDQFDISVFGDEFFAQYDRTLLPELLAGSLNERDLYVHPADWYAESQIAVHCGSRVTEIDRASQIVYARSGQRARYDMLVLATGNRAHRPPLVGLYSDTQRPRAGVFNFRTLEDCRLISQYASPSTTVAVLGGGFYALETACALRRRGCEVHLLHRGSQLSHPVLDSIHGSLLVAQLDALGMHIHLGTTVTEVLGDQRVTGVVFGDGRSLDCDFVVIQEDLQPDIEIGVRAGLTVDRAIVVDDFMRSVDDHDIYAVGGCAQYRGKVYEFVTQFWEQASVCAEHITGRGRSRAYRGSRPATTIRIAGAAIRLG
jgi:nitrite reductase (NADH) large subunit